MGCGGSKRDVHIDEGHDKGGVEKTHKRQDFKIEVQKEEDEEIFVLQEGKSISKSKLDEITEKNLSLSKVEVKKVEEEKKVEKKSEVHSKSLYEKREKNEEDAEEKEEKVEKQKEVVSKAKTIKVEFENHPHEFDFSYIDENKKDKNKDDDLLTDQILKEINDIS